MVCIKPATPETPHKLPLYVHKPWNRKAGNAIAWIFGLPMVLFVALGFGSGVRDQLDLDGHIPHDRTLDVYMTSNWLVGEHRICWLVLQKDANEKPTDRAGQSPVSGWRREA